MNGIRLYMPITKVNPETREVTGIFTAEAPDRSKEILDYDTSVPYFKAWSDEVAKNSGGKSLGNVREMHGKSAVGKVTDLNFDDASKVVEGTVKVVDDAAWAKVEEGVYTGFSIGGEYVKRWSDPMNPGLKRYTAQPVEVSLVDLPCLPDATFSMVKRHVEKSAAGDVPKEEVLETRAFKSTAEDAVFPYMEVDPELEQVWKSRDGKTFSKKADAIKHNEELDASDARKAATAGVKTITDAAVAAINSLAKAVAERDGKPADILELGDEAPAESKEQALAKAAEALVTDSPDTAGLIFDRLLGKAFGEGHLRLRKELPAEFKENADKKKAEAEGKGGEKSEDPKEGDDDKKATDKKAEDKEEKDTSKGADEKAEKGLELGSLRKGLWDVGRIGNIISDLAWIQENLCWEADYERDNSPLPAELGKVIAALITFMKRLLDEEASELLNGMEIEFADDGSVTVIKRGEASAEPSQAVQELAKGLAKAIGLEHLGDQLKPLAKAVNKVLEDEHASLLEKASTGAAASEKLAKLGGGASTSEISPVESGALQKALGQISVLEAENSVFKATMEKITPLVDTLQKRIETLEAQPLPPKGARVALGKTADHGDSGGGSGGPIRGADDLVKVLGESGLSQDEINKALMKHALRSPKQFGG